MTVHSLKSDEYIDAGSEDQREAMHASHSGRDLVRESEQKSTTEKCGGYEKARCQTRRWGADEFEGCPNRWGWHGALVACFGLCHSDEPVISFKLNSLLRHYGLYQVPRMIHVVPLVDRDMIREQLQRNDFKDR